MATDTSQRFWRGLNMAELLLRLQTQDALSAVETPGPSYAVSGSSARGPEECLQAGTDTPPHLYTCIFVCVVPFHRTLASATSVATS